ncbi:MAG TPA: MgtC/SapB family protein [Gemmatimonadales bacterium]
MTSDFASSTALVLRLVLAAALAAPLGWERERAGKSAGLRTHMLVCLAAALYTALGVAAAEDARLHDPDLKADPIRIIQAIAIGVGFLGGGMITKADGEVSGLTTGASIWSTAAIGIACGLGHVVLAIAVTVLQLVVVHVFFRFEPRRDA